MTRGKSYGRRVDISPEWGKRGGLRLLPLLRSVERAIAVAIAAFSTYAHAAFLIALLE
jgi:hypothetical protein